MDNLANQFAEAVDNARYAETEKETELFIRKAVEIQEMIETRLAELRAELNILEKVESSKAWYKVMKEARHTK